jgi:hypothetical protein
MGEWPSATSHGGQGNRPQGRSFQNHQRKAATGFFFFFF